MKELVGVCCNCRRPVYCLDGFLNGVTLKGKLFCFECAESRREN